MLRCTQRALSGLLVHPTTSITSRQSLSSGYGLFIHWFPLMVHPTFHCCPFQHSFFSICDLVFFTLNLYTFWALFPTPTPFLYIHTDNIYTHSVIKLNILASCQGHTVNSNARISVQSVWLNCKHLEFICWCCHGTVSGGEALRVIKGK